MARSASEEASARVHGVPGTAYGPAPELSPIDWWVWRPKDVRQLIVVTADTRLRAIREGVSKLKGARGIEDVDAQAWREGDTRESVLAQLASRRAA
jgi:hypothetical protein